MSASEKKLSRAEEIPKDPFTYTIQTFEQRISALESALHESTQSREQEIKVYQARIVELTTENVKHKRVIEILSTKLHPTISLLTAQANLQEGLNKQVQTSIRMLSSVVGAPAQNFQTALVEISTPESSEIL